jgi:two-component system, NtrC family, sensor kinase
MVACTAQIQQMAATEITAESLVRKLVDYFYNSFGDKEGKRVCALVRFFQTVSYSELPNDLKQLALQSLDDQHPDGEMKCMVLLATRGEQAEWNLTKHSRDHQVIALPSKEIVINMPMISGLIQDLGLEIEDVLQPPKTVPIGQNSNDFKVFLVPDALGSPAVPAQHDFVIPYGIRSVLGIGSLLPSGNMFALLLFCKVQISNQTAQMFKSITLTTNRLLSEKMDSIG